MIVGSENFALIPRRRLFGVRNGNDEEDYFSVVAKESLALPTIGVGTPYAVYQSMVPSFTQKPVFVVLTTSVMGGSRFDVPNSFEMVGIKKRFSF